MRTLYKYEYPDHLGEHSFWMPQGAIFRHAANINNKIFLWFEVINDHDYETRSFKIYGTGQTLHHKYVATVIVQQYVWHIYEDTI